MMSALGFEVHIDKENATPAALFNKGGTLKSFGSINNGRHIQPTPRKALIDVNNDARGQLGKDFGTNASKEMLFNSVKPCTKMSTGIENLQHGPHMKKPDSKKTLSLQQPHGKGLKHHKEFGLQPSTKKPERRQKRQHPPTHISDEEYDSDTIMPRHERLSTYVDKLLAWRPPCLFGTIPDSESDNEPDDLLNDDIINIPLTMIEVPQFNETDLDNLIEDLPPLETLDDETESAEQDRVVFEQTPDTSLSLGGLYMLNDSIMETSGY
ncbi:unnamed protein product [Lymnaea stagnalis]|uniref:Uncharacterized protein n=1 Tax=Lymnaea stagnalis TaxID=6523 RepID=A0AAV2GWW7_LYMST